MYGFGGSSVTRRVNMYFVYVLGLCVCVNFGAIQHFRPWNIYIKNCLNYQKNQSVYCKESIYYQKKNWIKYILCEIAYSKRIKSNASKYVYSNICCRISACKSMCFPWWKILNKTNPHCIEIITIVRVASFPSFSQCTTMHVINPVTNRTLATITLIFTIK